MDAETRLAELEAARRYDEAIDLAWVQVVAAREAVRGAEDREAAEARYERWTGVYRRFCRLAGEARAERFAQPAGAIRQEGGAR